MARTAIRLSILNSRRKELFQTFVDDKGRNAYTNDKLLDEMFLRRLFVLGETAIDHHVKDENKLKQCCRNAIIGDTAPYTFNNQPQSFSYAIQLINQSLFALLLCF